MTRCARPRWLWHWRSLHFLCAIGDHAHERLAVEGNRATWTSASAPVSISHPKRTLGHRSRLERFAKFCQCVSVPTGRRTVNTEPLPVSLVAFHVAAHHARALAGDGEAEPGAAEAAVYEKIERTLASFLLVMAISAFMWSHFETALLTLLCQTTHDLLVPIESVSSWCLIARDTLKNSSFRSLPGGFVREVHLNIDVRRTGQPTSAPGSMTTEI